MLHFPLLIFLPILLPFPFLNISLSARIVALRHTASLASMVLIIMDLLIPRIPIWETPALPQFVRPVAGRFGIGLGRFEKGLVAEK